MREIPFFNYSGLYEEHRDEYLSKIEDVLERGAFIMQRDLENFEANLASYLGCKHAIGVADGTAALIFSLRAAGIKPNDEVIVSSHTFVATASAVQQIGAIPVICDCGADSMMDVESAARMVTSKTVALMPTQLNGRTCDMNALTALADKHGLKIVEDSCQAMGAKFDGRPAGLWGVAGSYSFYPAKTLGCFGDGGAVVTNDDAVADQIRQMRDHGRNAEGKTTCWGQNGRLDNIQAAILDIKLARYDEAIERRRAIARIYNERLSGIEGLLLPPGPDQNDLRFDIFQNYEIQADHRDALRTHLSDANIGTIIQWGGYMLHQFEDLGMRFEADYAEAMSRRYMMLPLHHLLSDEDVHYVCDQINIFYK